MSCSYVETKRIAGAVLSWYRWESALDYNLQAFTFKCNLVHYFTKLPPTLVSSPYRFRLLLYNKQYSPGEDGSTKIIGIALIAHN